MDAGLETAPGPPPAGLAWGLRVAASGLLIWAIFFGGGSGGQSVPWLGAAATLVAAGSLVCVALGIFPAPNLDRYGLMAVAAALLLLVWGGVTIWWSIAGDRSWAALDKGLVYLAFGVVGLVLGGLGRATARQLALVAAGVLGAALVWALAGKAIPALGPEEAGRVARLQSPVGYWNGLALLAGAAIPLGLWLVSAARMRARGLRSTGALLVYAGALTILLTQSRAGLLAAVVVGALWLVLEPARVEAAVLGLLAACPALAVGGWAFTRPALVEDGGSHADRVADGAVLGILLLVGAAAVIALAVAVPVERIVADRRRTVVRSLAGAAGLLAVAGVVALVAAVGNPVTWAHDQVSGNGAVVNDPTRFGSLETNNRTAWWGEAWQVFRANPGGGTGAYTFAIARTRYRDDGSFVQEPHSVPMQLLSDTGLPGLALGLALAAAALLGLRLAIRRAPAQERSTVAALAALPVVYALHTLVDYDPDFIAVTAPAALVAAFLVAAFRPPIRVRGGIPAAAGVAVAAAAILYSLAAPTLASRDVDEAFVQLDKGAFASAAEAARDAQALNPLSPEPLWARATVAGRAGDEAGAEALYDQATRLQPENPATWQALGIYRQVSGDQCGAYQAFNAAYTLDPMSRFWTEGGPLDQARDAVNAGACEG